LLSLQVRIGHTDVIRAKLIFAGGSSGIGLATVDLLQSLGAVVVSGDIQEPPVKSDLLFVKTDARSWTDLTILFKAAKDKHGRVDYVFANAGIGPRADYLNLAVNENGDVQEPNKDTLDINFSSVVNTVTLGAHYLKSNAEGGSIVIMGSSTGLHPVRAVDYCKSPRRPKYPYQSLTTYFSRGKGWYPRLRPQFRQARRSSWPTHPRQHPRPFMDRHPGASRPEGPSGRRLAELPIYRSCRTRGGLLDGHEVEERRPDLCLRRQIHRD
jgi:hypothetical protein